MTAMVIARWTHDSLSLTGWGTFFLTSLIVAVTR